MRDFLTKQELADNYCVLVKTINHWVKKLNCPNHKFGETVVFIKKDVEKWHENRANQK